MTKEYPWGKGTVNSTYDSTADDSDKTFTVPDGKVWRLRYVLAQIAATATVGNRTLCVWIKNAAANGILPPVSTASITASQYGGLYMPFGVPFASYTTTFRRIGDPTNMLSVCITQGMPEVLLAAGSTVRVYDINAIDPAADDLTVVLHYVEYDA